MTYITDPEILAHIEANDIAYLREQEAQHAAAQQAQQAQENAQ